LRRPLFLLAAGSALALAGTALAGGWATVQLSSTPHGVSAGQPWVVDITVLQHGKTPLAGVKPTVTIYKAAARATSAGSAALKLTFAAKPTARTGVYRARVVFPSAGTWRYQVYDGFTQYGGAQTHRYAPVKIAARAT
jgi:YtkA-like protein